MTPPPVQSVCSVGVGARVQVSSSKAGGCVNGAHIEKDGEGMALPLLEQTKAGETRPPPLEVEARTKSERGIGASARNSNED